MTDTKYIVFKRTSFDDLLIKVVPELTPSVGDALNVLASEQIEDAVVIRKQDVFAAPALDAYANAIAVAIEVLSSHNRGNNNPMVESLKAIADYFHSAASASWEMDRKIPD